MGYDEYLYKIDPNASGNTATGAQFVKEVASSMTFTTLLVISTAVEAKVGASALTGRSFIRLVNPSSTFVHWGINTVTSSGVTEGEKFKDREWIKVNCNDSVTIKVIAATTTGATITIYEGF